MRLDEYREVTEMQNRIDKVKKQRDDMLKALNRAHRFIDEITSAIGKYKGLQGPIVADAYAEASALKLFIIKIEKDLAS